MKPVIYVACLVLCAAALSPALARAEATGAGPAPVRYDFEDELVPGDLVRPDVEMLTARRRGSRRSLVDVRSSYLAELLETVEKL